MCIWHRPYTGSRWQYLPEANPQCISNQQLLCVWLCEMLTSIAVYRLPHSCAGGKKSPFVSESVWISAHCPHKLHVSTLLLQLGKYNQNEQTTICRAAGLCLPARKLQRPAPVTSLRIGRGLLPCMLVVTPLCLFDPPAATTHHQCTGHGVCCIRVHTFCCNQSVSIVEWNVCNKQFACKVSFKLAQVTLQVSQMCIMLTVSTLTTVSVNSNRMMLT